MERINNVNSMPGICMSDLIMYFIIISFFCYTFYKYLAKRTINIENFDSTDKITYSIDGHPISVNDNDNYHENSHQHSHDINV